MISTKSWLRMWWLTMFRGYRVSRTERVPKQYVFGRLTYDNTWWLRHVSGEDGG